MRPWYLFLMLMGFISVAFAQTSHFSSPNKFHVYLLMGQSNMAVRDHHVSPRPMPLSAAARVMVMDVNGNSAPLKKPIQHISDQLGKSGVGPGAYFAISMAEQNPSVTIGLVPLAVGGSALSTWEKGAPNLNSPDLPVVIGELGKFLSKPHRREMFSYWKVVNDGIRLLPLHDPKIAIVTSEGLSDRGDAIHFNAISADELGKRYAEALNEIRGQNLRGNY